MQNNQIQKNQNEETKERVMREAEALEHEIKNLEEKMQNPEEKMQNGQNILTKITSSIKEIVDESRRLDELNKKSRSDIGDNDIFMIGLEIKILENDLANAKEIASQEDKDGLINQIKTKKQLFDNVQQILKDIDGRNIILDEYTTQITNYCSMSNRVVEAVDEEKIKEKYFDNKFSQEVNTEHRKAMYIKDPNNQLEAELSKDLDTFFQQRNTGPRKAMYIKDPNKVEAAAQAVPAEPLVAQARNLVKKAFQKPDQQGLASNQSQPKGVSISR